MTSCRKMAIRGRRTYRLIEAALLSRQEKLAHPESVILPQVEMTGKMGIRVRLKIPDQRLPSAEISSNAISPSCRENLFPVQSEVNCARSRVYMSWGSKKPKEATR
jgi:hypothetical protein